MHAVGACCAPVLYNRRMIIDAIETDWPLIEGLAERAEVFTEEELDALGAILEEYALLGPEESGYDLLVDQVDDRVLGFICYGPRDLTDGVCELYYLVVDPAYRKQSVGRRLLKAAEAEAREAGARMMMAETSSAPRFGGSGEFCRKAGYQVEAGIRDFYALGEDMAVLVKRF
jgi:GNAT superfamily N-acetyltransferase